MSEFTIVPAQDSPVPFTDWRAQPAFSHIEEHPTYCAQGHRYFAAVNRGAREDLSFAVMRREQPFLLVPCSAAPSSLDYWGLPIRFFARSDTDPSGDAAAVAVDYLSALLERHGCRRTIIQDIGAERLSAVGKLCMTRGYEARLRLVAACDLSSGEAGMKRGLRKSFKSLINWGYRNLDIVAINRANPDRNLFHEYEAFHCRTAGQQTRPSESWEIMFEWLASGHGQLTLGFLSGDLVAGTLFLDGKAITNYASGVYDRARFDKPLAHTTLWRAMVDSIGRGIRSVDLGEIPLEGTVSQKEYSIGYFKRGFATEIHCLVDWSKERVAAS